MHQLRDLPHHIRTGWVIIGVIIYGDFDMPKNDRETQDKPKREKEYQREERRDRPDYPSDQPAVADTHKPPPPKDKDVG